MHLFHAEYPSARDYPDLSYAALELALWKRKVFYHTLLTGGIQIQKMELKNASILFLLCYMQINIIHTALSVSIQARI